MEPEKNNYEFQFELGYEDYYRYNLFMAQRSLEKAKRKQTTIGIVEIIIGILLLLLTIMDQSGQSNIFYYILNALIIGMGIYSILFYRIFFAKQLKKAVRKTYDSSDYLKGDIEIQFNEDSLRESGVDRDNIFRYEEINGITITADLVLVMIDTTKAVVIPRSIIPAEKAQEFYCYLQQICQTHEKAFLSLDRDLSLEEIKGNDSIVVRDFTTEPADPKSLHLQ